MTDQHDRAAAAQTTVYADNARAARGARQCEPGWHAAIADLVRRDYAFLPLRYAGREVLFRGMASGIGAALDAGQCGTSDDEHALNALERETGVVFVSQDVSDAIAVARLWEAPQDGGVLVIPADSFARAHAAGAAAILGFADPGMVFRYPCFAPPLVLDDEVKVMVHAAAAPAVAGIAPQRVMVLPRETPADRGGVAAALARLLDAAGLKAASAERATRYPRRV